MFIFPFQLPAFLNSNDRICFSEKDDPYKNTEYDVLAKFSFQSFYVKNRANTVIHILSKKLQLFEDFEKLKKQKASSSTISNFKKFHWHGFDCFNLFFIGIFLDWSFFNNCSTSSPKNSIWFWNSSFDKSDWKFCNVWMNDCHFLTKIVAKL